MSSVDVFDKTADILAWLDFKSSQSSHLTRMPSKAQANIFTSSNSAPSQQQEEEEQMFACAFDGMRVKWEDWELLKSNQARISAVLSKTSTEDIFVDKEEEHLAQMDID
jgi:hypothetical protein